MTAISFDMDGVLTGGSYIPEWDRRPYHYRDLPLLEECAPEIFNDLAKRYDVYIISARNFENSTRITKEWLESKGFEGWMGICTGISVPRKAKLVKHLGISLHIDDHPEVCRILGDHALLFDSPEWDANQTLVHRRIHSIAELPLYLSETL